MLLRTSWVDFMGLSYLCRTWGVGRLLSGAFCKTINYNKNNNWLEISFKYNKNSIGWVIQSSCMWDASIDAVTPTPCTQGCLRTRAALRRRVASRTNSLEMRSLAPSVMRSQSLAGNSYLPCWMLSNRWLCGEETTTSCQSVLSLCILEWGGNGGILQAEARGFGPGRFCRFLRGPSHSRCHSGPWRGGCRSTGCRGWPRDSRGHSACRRKRPRPWTPPRPLEPCTPLSRTGRNQNTWKSDATVVH